VDKDDLVLISVDDHVIEPPDLFVGRLPRALQERAPRVEEENGHQFWVLEDEIIRYIGLNAVAGRPREEYNNEPTNFNEMRRGCWDIHERIADMDANGVLASLCFPTFCQFAGQAFSRQKDRKLALATIQAYNDWHIEDWCGTYRGRMIPCGVVPLWDGELMAAEVRRLAAKGCHAVTVSEAPHKLGYPSYHTDFWDPFFAACTESGTVVCTHLGSSSSLPETAPDAPIDTSIALIGINLVFASTDLLWSGALLRFPELKWALSEGGIGWIPYFLERVDYVHEHHSPWTGADFGGRRPSEIFREHVITCFVSDSVGVRLRDLIGVDMICWESDYPHSDSTWPHSPEVVATYTADLPSEDIERILYRNAMRHFQFDPFDHIPREQATVAALRARAADRDLTFSDGRRQQVRQIGPALDIRRS
jgi:predicted TIM-barrel fold metal-dependent hydrolase